MRLILATFLSLMIAFAGLAVGPPPSQTNTSDSKTEAAIRAVLDAQAAAWNRGDLEGYMDGYDRSPNTEFVSGDRINHGWHAALVLGRWRLKRANDEPHGTFSLLFRKTKTGWRIVHDHSSAA